MKFTIACLISAAASTKTFIQECADFDGADACLTQETDEGIFRCYFDLYCAEDDECINPCEGLMEGAADECYAELADSLSDQSDAESWLSELEDELTDFDEDDVIEYYEEYFDETNPCDSEDGVECLNDWICQFYGEEDFDWCVENYGVEATLSWLNYDGDDYDEDEEDWCYGLDGDELDLCELYFDELPCYYTETAEEDAQCMTDYICGDAEDVEACQSEYAMYIYDFHEDGDYEDDYEEGEVGGEGFGPDKACPESWEEGVAMLGDFDPCEGREGDDLNECGYYFGSGSDPCPHFGDEEETNACYDVVFSFLPDDFCAFDTTEDVPMTSEEVPMPEDDGFLGIFAQITNSRTKLAQ